MIHDASKDSRKFFEDFSSGDIFKHWPGKTITEMDNHMFSLMTMNHNPLHIDHNYMASHEHKQPLVNGLLTISIVVGMSVADLSIDAIANLGYENIRHNAPVFHGDTIYAESKILDTRESKSKSDRGIVHLETCAYNQKKELVLTLQRSFLSRKRSTDL
ncbi:MAG: MaoC family dehydratase [Dehalococcoidia bacterium]